MPFSGPKIYDFAKYSSNLELQLQNESCFINFSENYKFRLIYQHFIRPNWYTAVHIGPANVHIIWHRAQNYGTMLYIIVPINFF